MTKGFLLLLIILWSIWERKRKKSSLLHVDPIWNWSDTAFTWLTLWLTDLYEKYVMYTALSIIYPIDTNDQNIGQKRIFKDKLCRADLSQSP